MKPACDFSLFLGGPWLSQLPAHFCKRAPPCGLCLHCSFASVPLHHHHHTHTTPQVLRYCCVCAERHHHHHYHHHIYLFIYLFTKKSAQCLPSIPASICWIAHQLFFLTPCLHSSIHISRKSWHTLLNTCFHIAMTTAIYAGGISLTSYPVVCQAVSTARIHSFLHWFIHLFILLYM